MIDPRSLPATTGPDPYPDRPDRPVRWRRWLRWLRDPAAVLGALAGAGLVLFHDRLAPAYVALGVPDMGRDRIAALGLGLFLALTVLVMVIAVASPRAAARMHELDPIEDTASLRRLRRSTLLSLPAMAAGAAGLIALALSSTPGDPAGGSALVLLALAVAAGLVAAPMLGRLNGELENSAFATGTGQALGLIVILLSLWSAAHAAGLAPPIGPVWPAVIAIATWFAAVCIAFVRAGLVTLIDQEQP